MPSRNSIQIMVNQGQKHELTFDVYTDMDARSAAFYRQIHISIDDIRHVVWVSENVNIFEVAIGGTFDPSIPQSLWDRLADLGSRGSARGVYCYDTTLGREYNLGRFMHYFDALEIASKKIAEALKEAGYGR